jgi:hypothetical protein
MNEAHDQDDELRDLDLSSLSFVEFVDFFFACPNGATLPFAKTLAVRRS